MSIELQNEHDYEIKNNLENTNSYLNIFKKIYGYFEDWLDRQEKKIMLKKLMEDCNTYEEWSNYAKELDIVERKESWKKKKESSQYDYKELEKLIKVLQKKKEMKDISGLVHYIRSNLVKNLYSTLNPRLYQVCHHGTKYLIEDFNEEMLKSLDFISNYNEKIFPLHKKLEFFSETRHSYGRTSLLLSGGASLGIYHIGVIKTLYKQNLLPRIICGSSAGSIVASIVCTTPYEKVIDDIERDFKNGGPFQYKDKKNSIFFKILKYITSGVLYDVEVLSECLREEIGDVTFQEAFDRTGWILNITVTGYKEHANHRLLNYLTAPNVLIWSASCASSCVPGLFDPTELMCKNEYGHIVPYSSNRVKFIDGSLSADLPMQRLSELFNVNIFIVSQTNPWVIPFLEQEDHKEVFQAEKTFNLWKLIKTLIFSEIKHRFIQIQTLGILPKFITKWFNIITQDYKGHVTIFPVPKIVDYFKIFDNPNKESIVYATIHASRRTFPSKI